ncbi:MAG: aminopeptidase P family protein [Clostridia bacterium]|nr:aminopeptidase P family protein [Clostridia bacterium]
MNRIEKIQKHFPSGVDAFITSNEKTCLYLSEFLFSDGMIFVTKDDATIYTDFRYLEAAEQEAVGCKISVSPRFEAIRKTVEEKGIRVIGYEDDLLFVSELATFKQQIPGCEFVPMGGVIRELAEYKDEREMALVREAQKITDEAFAAVLPLLRPDMKETDVAAELEYQMKKRGASGTSFETIAVSGTNSARPHGVPRPVTLERGFLTMDFGCYRKGYASDMTRTVVIGRADNDMKKVYDTVLRAQLAAIDAVREGMTGAELDRVARDIIHGAGYEGCFGHGLGHGVGIYIHENPRVSAVGRKPLTRGHIFTVEPGIYLKGKYGVRIEDMIQMTENDPVDITASPKDLIEIL